VGCRKFEAALGILFRASLNSIAQSVWADPTEHALPKDQPKGYLRAGTCRRHKLISLGVFSHTCILNTSPSMWYSLVTTAGTFDYSKSYPLLPEVCDVATLRACSASGNISFVGWRSGAN
jgi:hypothetical protein